VCDDEEGHPLKQYNLVRLTDPAKVVQMALQQLDVGDERVHDGRPCLLLDWICGMGCTVIKGWLNLLVLVKSPLLTEIHPFFFFFFLWLACLVEGFIPDGGPESDDLQGQGPRLQLEHTVVVDLVPLILLHEIHFVDQTKDLCILRVGHDGFQARLIVMHILFDISAFHIEYIDQDLDVLEDMIAL